MRPARADALVRSPSRWSSPAAANVAVFQPDIHGVQLSPIANFTFLQDVYRRAPGR
jgi:hypothetical protein